MGAKVAITRMDHTGAELRAQSAKCADGAQVRRMLALALVLDGRSRSEAAVLNGMDRQTLRDWVHRYNEAGIEGLKSRKSHGREPYLTTQQMAERLKFAGITLFTLAEGEISELHIGLKGTINALFLKDLAEKTRRGLLGRVAAGKSAGGLCYGYKLAPKIMGDGMVERGDRRIDEAEAAIVRHIFRSFAEGLSPIAIAKQLNQEGIPGPDGRPWQDTAIRGHAARATGILRNELYIGRLVWNRMRYMKAPNTGKRVSHMNPREQWVTEEVPQLRIVEQEVWNQVQHRLAGIREASGANDPDRPKYWETRRAKHLLTGKLFCASCGGALSAVGRDYLACGGARKRGTCANSASSRRSQLEAAVIEALRSNLMAPDDVHDFVKEFTAEWNRLAAESNAGRAHDQSRLAAIQLRIPTEAGQGYRFDVGHRSDLKPATIPI